MRPCFLLSGIAFGLLTFVAVGAAAQPVLSYSNPVYSGDFPDPTVIRHAGRYYAFGTTGHSRLPDGRIFTLIASDDLVHWSELGGALEPPSEDASLEYWAPEICERDGVFYLYYSQGNLDTMDFKLRVATSARPEGPYQDLGVQLKDGEGATFTIDGFPFRDDDGQWYFFYAKDYIDTANGHRAGTGIAVDRLIDMTRLEGKPKLVARARYDWTIFKKDRLMPMYGNKRYDWHTIEGPYVVRHEGKIYCFYSGSNFGTVNYGLDYVIADSPLGTYAGQGEYARVLRGVPELVRGPGHHGMTVAPDGRTPVVLYHAWDAEMKRRQLWIDPLVWTPVGPRVAGPSVGPTTIKPRD